MKKKVIVIGGGIAGLSAGIYALRCGFEVSIFERHTLAGGVCTSWKRGGYLFEGGMHWLTGSGKNEGLHALWRTVGALDDSVNIHYPEPFAEFDWKGTPIRLYRDVNATEQHWLELSPADAKEIRKFCNNIRKLSKLGKPVRDLKGVKVTKKRRLSLSRLFSALLALCRLRAYFKVSAKEYAARFSHEGIGEMLCASSYEQGMGMLFLTMGSLTRGDGGFPEGGSLPFVQRMVNTFKALGGKIHYKTPVRRLILEKGKTTGVLVGDTAAGDKAVGDKTGSYQTFPADAVIVTVDTMAIEHLFETPPKAPWLKKMRKATEPTMVTFVSLGINASLKHYPSCYLFKPPKPIGLSTQTYPFLSVNNYASNPTFSPEGKSTLTLLLPGDTYDFWKKAQEEGRYLQEKQKLAKAVIAALEAQMPEIQNQVEVWDIATPLTYERYCGNWKGSWMTELTPNVKLAAYPATLKGLKGVYFAGQRMMPPGGLPMALLSARAAVQCLCRETGTTFVSETAT